MNDETTVPEGQGGEAVPLMIDHPDAALVYLLDGKGGGVRLPEGEPLAACEDRSFHVIIGSPASAGFRQWLTRELGMVDAMALTEPSMQSHCQIVDDRAMLVLRVARAAVEMEEIGEQPIGIWIEHRRLILVTDVGIPEFMGWPAQATMTHGPISPGDFVARSGLRAADRLEPLLERIDDDLDQFEEATLLGRARDYRNQLAALRRTLIGIRRLLWPQRDALGTLEVEELSFFSRRDRTRLRQASQRTARLGDEVQALSERSGLVHEHLLDQRAEQMNRAMLILAVVTTVFMPLTLITGMFGMNLPGIPFFHDGNGFWIVTLIMAVLAVLEVLWFWRRKWF